MTQRHAAFALLLGASALALGACGEKAQLPESAGYGANPQLPEPRTSMIPTLKVADAEMWREGEKPAAAAGLSVAAFADKLDHPRWLYVLPNGDVLVAETNAPPKTDDTGGIKGWFMRRSMSKAGAGGASPDRITLLRDTNGDGVADMRTTLIKNLNSPFGMALIGNNLFVANTDAIVAYPYVTDSTMVIAQPKKVADLPDGPINYHWAKNIIASRDGTRLYATVGSNSNAGERGPEAEQGRAAIWEIDLTTLKHRVFASGLRNPNGLAWEPTTGRLWTAVNERDELGSDLVPDYMTSVKDGGFYGWPYSYFGQHVDDRVKPQRPDLVARAIKPDYALGAHTAAMGLAFYEGHNLPAAYKGGAFIGQHGSWNRDPPSGYKVIFVPFTNGRPSGPPQDVLTGFLSPKGKAHGRPVGVTVDKSGALLVADDVGNRIWRVTGAGPTSKAQP